MGLSVLSFNLLSKIHIFSPKNLRFFFVKFFWVVPATVQNYQINPWASAVADSCQTKKNWSDFWTGCLALCAARLSFERAKKEKFLFLYLGLKFSRWNWWRKLLTILQACKLQQSTVPLCFDVIICNTFFSFFFLPTRK